jgi:hypothetical protein
MIVYGAKNELWSKDNENRGTEIILAKHNKRR